MTLANETVAEAQQKSDVTLLDKGRFALTWVESNLSKLAETHYIRFYDKSGKALSEEIQVSKRPGGLTGLDTEWIKLKDGSLAEVYADGGAIKGLGVPKPVFGTAKAEKFGTAGNDFVIAAGGNDTLKGGAGVDILVGGAGADVISGGARADTLAGGKGADRFVFDAKLGAVPEFDAIIDFSAADDTIALDGRVFAGLGKAGALAPDLFKDLGLVGAFADADDRILYDSKSGALSYDKDAGGSAPAVKFAQLENRALLTAADFIVV